MHTTGTGTSIQELLSNREARMYFCETGNTFAIQVLILEQVDGNFYNPNFLLN